MVFTGGREDPRVEGSNSTPLVVVVTPTYNGSAYLRETMDSVQAQTYPNLIHLVLDNASTDEVPAILADYADTRVPVIRIRNATTLPQKENWNTAFGHVPSEATYVRLLCDDDTITPDSIARMVAVAETDPKINVVGCWHHSFGDIQKLKWPADRTLFDGPEAVRMTLLSQGELMPMQMMWRKAAVDRLQPLFSDEIYMMWDLDTAMELMMQGKYAFIHECLGFTRVHPGTVTAQLNLVGTRVSTRNAADLLRKYGPAVLGADYAKEMRRFLRYYVRRILMWRREPEAKDWLGSHYQALQRAGWSWGPPKVADALFFWALQRVGLVAGWTGFPGWQ